YWRITLFGPSANTSFGSGLASFELHSGLVAGNPQRLAGGTTGTVLTMVNGQPAWASLPGAVSTLFTGNGATKQFSLPDVQAARRSTSARRTPLTSLEAMANSSAAG